MTHMHMHISMDERYADRQADTRGAVGGQIRLARYARKRQTPVNTKKTFLCLPCPHPSIHSPGRHPFAQPPSHHATPMTDTHGHHPSITSSIHRIPLQGVRSGRAGSGRVRPTGRQQAGQEKYPYLVGRLAWCSSLTFRCQSISQPNRSAKKQQEEEEKERWSYLYLSVRLRSSQSVVPRVDWMCQSGVMGSPR